MGIIVNFVCRNLFWGTWVTHHFYAIVKGPDTLEGAKGAPGAGGGGVSGSEGEARSIEDGGSGGVGQGGGESGEEEGESRFKRLGPASRRAKQETQNRDGSGEGVSDGGGGGGGGKEGSERATGLVWYSLDSRLPKPQRLGGRRGLMAHLAWEVREHHGHVFVVRKGLEAEDDCSDDRGQNLASV